MNVSGPLRQVIIQDGKISYTCLEDYPPETNGRLAGKSTMNEDVLTFSSPRL